MLADCPFFQDDEWIWWASPSEISEPQPVPTDCIQVTVSAAKKRFERQVPFLHGVKTRQILAALYPCNWGKLSFSFHGGERLQDVCLGNFCITIFDTRSLVEGIGWTQISPFEPVRLIFEKVGQRRGLDISSFQLCIDGRVVDHDILIAALMPFNLFYICDAFGKRYVNFVTPSVKRRQGSSGRFLPQLIS